MSFLLKSSVKKCWALTNESHDLNDEANEILNETLSVSGQQLVKLFTKEEIEYHRYQTVNKQLTQVKVKETTVGGWFRMVAQTSIEAGPCLYTSGGGILLLINHFRGLTVGDITFFVAF